MSESEKYRRAKRELEALGEQLVRWADRHSNGETEERWLDCRARVYDRVPNVANEGNVMLSEVQECLGREALKYLREERRSRDRNRGGLRD